MQPLKAPKPRTDVPCRAVLVQRQDAKIDDMSRTGCRVETGASLAIGTIGLLTVEIEGRRHVELFRVCRSLARIEDGRQQFEAGVEFLPIPADTASLHDVAAQLDRSDAS
jgi:hypothetical protein